MTLAGRVPRTPTTNFRHEAAFYRGLDQMVGRVLPYVREGVELGESVLVVMLPERIRLIEEALGADAAQVRFLDMGRVGQNPARIIPEWRRFIDHAAGKSFARGVAEPVWAGRRDVEIEECRLHESLLNVAFDDGPTWRLMCPYDVDALPDHVVQDAMRTHPMVLPDGERGQGYEGHEHAFAAFAEPLADSPTSVFEIAFRVEDLTDLRGTVWRLCERAGLEPDAADVMILAAHEVASNSIDRGGGRGVLRAWTEPDALVVEVRDSSTIDDPLAGRRLASGLAESGRGLWIANQLCDLVQVRSTSGGTVVRLFSWL